MNTPNLSHINWKPFERQPQEPILSSLRAEKIFWKKDEYMANVEVALYSPNLDRMLTAHILKAPCLRWIQQLGAGANNLLMDHPEVVESDLIVTNTKGIHAISISEHILGLMFTLSLKIQCAVRDQIKHCWGKHTVTELEGSTVGIIGIGVIGEKTAEKAKALNMRVLGLRRNFNRTSPWVDQMFSPSSLLEMLPQVDWLVITAALTHETKDMIAERELRAMKNSAYLINIARGAILQERALLKGLRERWIAGAGLDVFEEEPLPENSPFWDLDNVVMTCHYAGNSIHRNDRMLVIFTENLRRYQSGEPLINLVDKRLGY